MLLISYRSSNRPMEKAIKLAAANAGVNQQASHHTLRQSFAAHQLQSGADIRTAQEQLGHGTYSRIQIIL